MSRIFRDAGYKEIFILDFAVYYNELVLAPTPRLNEEDLELIVIIFILVLFYGKSGAALIIYILYIHGWSFYSGIIIIISFSLYQIVAGRIYVICL